MEQGSHGELITRPSGVYATLLKLQMAARDQTEQPWGQTKQDVADEAAEDADAVIAAAVPADQQA